MVRFLGFWMRLLGFRTRGLYLAKATSLECLISSKELVDFLEKVKAEYGSLDKFHAYATTYGYVIRGSRLC